jgi:hypothetical protein
MSLRPAAGILAGAVVLALSMTSCGPREAKLVARAR